MEVKDSLQAIELFYERGWTDGLPVIPPTEELVAEMISYSGRDSGEITGAVPPSGGIATVEKVAINAVMAGCVPSYFPVVLAAVEASLEDRFSLNGVSVTTAGRVPLIIVNGPVAKQIGMNSGPNCFGQGNRANASIGRALRLVHVNIGGAVPGEVDKSTFGHPGKFTFCISENEDANPWEPYHVEKGFRRDDSTVALFAGDAPHHVSYGGYHTGASAEGVLVTMADALANLGHSNMYYITSEVLVIFSPLHAKIIAREGWSKRDVRLWLFDKARRSVSELAKGGLYGREKWPKWLGEASDAVSVPFVKDPDDIMIIVAGGSGNHSVFLVPWMGRAVIRKINITTEGGS